MVDMILNWVRSLLMITVMALNSYKLTNEVLTPEIQVQNVAWGDKPAMSSNC